MVSIVIVAYNGLEHLKACLPSIARQAYADTEVIIIDNASTDGSPEYVRQEFPHFHLHCSPVNLGYAAANNLGFQLARGETIAVLNQDTRVDPNWLEPLLVALERYPDAGLVTPKILLFDRPDTINTCGNQITFSGLTFCRGLEESSHQYTRLEPVSAVSGAVFLIKRSVLDQIGGFDERFFMYYEETDLSLRAALAGYTCYYVPESIVYHKYVFRYSPQKAYYQERNRYFALLKTLRWPTLLALLPSLLAAEVIAWGYALLHGPAHLASKFRTYTWLAGNFSQVLQARRQVQRLRKVGDRQILRRFDSRLNFTQTAAPWAARLLDWLVNPLLFLFGKLSQIVVAW